MLQSLSADLFTLGYTNQLNVDFSSIAIEQMQQKYADLNLDWQVMVHPQQSSSSLY